MIFIGISAFAQTTPTAIITGNAVGVIGPGGTIYPVSLQIQLTGCGPAVPIVPGGSVVTNFYKQSAPGPSYSATITAYGNDVITCGTQSYTTYAATWLINNQPAAPTATYRLVQGQTCNISDGSCKPIGFVPPVISKGAGLFCPVGQSLQGFNADYTPACQGVTTFPLPTFLTNGIANSNQTILNLIGTGGISAAASGGNITLNGSGFIQKTPTLGQTVTQPINTIFNFMTSGTGQVQYNGSEIMTTAIAANFARLISSTTQNFVQSGGSLLQYNGSEILNKVTGVQLAPLASQIVNQPVVTGTQTSLNVNSLNGVLNATLFAGADIGAKINAAIALLPNGCGTISIPAGIFNQSTTINKPRCVSIIGSGGLATVLNWTPANGFAVLARDAIPAPFGFPVDNAYPQGQIADLTFNGPCTRGSGGTTCTGTSTAIFFGATAPDMTNFGDHQNLNRVRINLFNTGITYGNNAWSIDVNQSLINFNVTGVVFPSAGGGPTTNSGESLSFTNTRIQGNMLGFDLPGYADFYFFGGSCDFNINGCGNVNIAHFFGYHFESSRGRMLTMVTSASNNIGAVEIYGGQVALDQGAVTTSEIFAVTGIGNPTFKITGTNIVIANTHVLTNVVNWAGVGANAVLSITDLSFIGGIGAFTGPVANTTCTFTGCRIMDPASGFYAWNGAGSSLNNNGNVAFNGRVTSQNQTLTGQTGTGNAMLCINATGGVFRGTATTCP